MTKAGDFRLPEAKLVVVARCEYGNNNTLCVYGGTNIGARTTREATCCAYHVDLMRFQGSR